MQSHLKVIYSGNGSQHEAFDLNFSKIVLRRHDPGHLRSLNAKPWKANISLKMLFKTIGTKFVT